MRLDSTIQAVGSMMMISMKTIVEFHVCLFVYADGKERQIKAATLEKQVSRGWDLAAGPRNVCF